MRVSSTRLAGVVAMLLAGACGGTDGGGTGDGADGSIDGASLDAASSDGSVPTDGLVPDAGSGWDAGEPPDCPLPLERALSLPTDHVSSHLAGTGHNDATSCTAEADGPDHRYPLFVEEKTGVDFSVTGVTDAIVAVRRACAEETSEIGCSGRHNRLRTALGPGHYTVLVDRIPAGEGDYELAVTTFDVAENAVCEDATPVAHGTLIENEKLAEAGTAAGECGSVVENALFYSVTIPAMHRLRAVADVGTRIRLLDDCDSRTCVADGSSLLRYRNESSVDRDAVLMVAGPADTVFDLSIDISPFADNRTCASAESLGTRTTFTGDTTLGADDPPPCSYATGTDTTAYGLLYYAAVVPPGKRLYVQTTERWLHFVRIADSCSPDATCLGSPDMSSTDAFWVNSGEVDEEVVFFVGAHPCPETTGPGVGDTECVDSPGPFEGTIELTTAATNLTCGTALPIDDSATVTGDLRLATSDLLPSTCAGPASRVLWYTATIPAGADLQARVTPTVLAGMADPQLVVVMFPDCSASSCLDWAETFDGSEAVVEHTNVTASPMDVIVAVSALEPIEGLGPFELDLTFSAP